MEIKTVYEKTDKTDSRIINYSDDELIFKELCTKCNSLKTQNITMIQLRENLSILNEKNESIYESLLKIKTECETYKANLYKKLHTLKISTDKRRILSRKKLDELYSKQKKFEEYYRSSPCKVELDELIRKNKSLEQKWENKTTLFKLTVEQYNKFESLVTEAFKKKVCEFCDTVLKFKKFNN